MRWSTAPVPSREPSLTTKIEKLNSIESAECRDPLGKHRLDVCLFIVDRHHDGKFHIAREHTESVRFGNSGDEPIIRRPCLTFEEASSKIAG